MHGAHSGPTDAPPRIMPWAVTAAITLVAARARTVAATVGRRWRNFPQCLSLPSLAEQFVLPRSGSSRSSPVVL